MTSVPAIDVSIIIVNYNVKRFAEQCLRSVYAAQKNLTIEIFLVDNASTDGSIEFLQGLYPHVQYIANAANLGFSCANNQALARAAGRYLLILNPDTLLGEDSLEALVAYLESHPRVGALGPKILTRDGGFDVTSKRGFPTPWVAFCRLSGLAFLFPQTKIFGRYNLLYLNPDDAWEVDALAGSCMLVRRETYQQVGGFDEDFFMFGEDIDWSVRIKAAGWEVHYAPVTKIVHFKGESTRRSDIDRDRAFYGAMHLFVAKHFRGRYPRAAHWMIDLGIVLARLSVQIKRLSRRFFAPTVDFAGLWLILVLGRYVRWGAVGIEFKTALPITWQALTWVLCLAGFGIYHRRRGQWGPLWSAMTLGFLLNSTITYFFKQYDFSRSLNLFGWTAGGIFVWLWRLITLKLGKSPWFRDYYRRRTLIVGAGDTARAVLKWLLSEERPHLPVGFIDPEQCAVGQILDGLPVLGEESELARIVDQEEIEEVLFAYDRLDYNRALEVISSLGRRRGVNFKIIPPEHALQTDGLDELLAVEYLYPRGWKGALRKASTLLLGR
ncbi:MAG: glycosyltransferase [Calditrichota bacterium]